MLCAHFERKASKAARGEVGHAAGALPREEEGGEADAGQRSLLLCTPFWLFNVAQIDGLPTAIGISLAIAACCAVAQSLKPGMKIAWDGATVYFHGTWVSFVPVLFTNFPSNMT